MITDGKKWHYLAVKSFSALLRGTTSDNNRDFYSLNCFHLYSTKDKLKKHKNAFENHDHCYVEMPKKDNKILKYKHGKKSMKVQFITYAGSESLPKKMNTCHSNPKKSSTTKVNEHIPSGYSLLTYCSFDTTNSKLDCYRSEDCIKNLCIDLKEHATKIISYEKKRNDIINKRRRKENAS